MIWNVGLWLTFATQPQIRYAVPCHLADGVQVAYDASSMLAT